MTVGPFVQASELYDVERREQRVEYWVAVCRALVSETESEGGAA